MKAEKELLLDEVKNQMNSQAAFVIMRYERLNANKANDFRREIAKFGGNIEIVRKRLLVKAAEALGVSALITREYDRSLTNSGFIEWVVLSGNSDVVSRLKAKGWRTLPSNRNFRLWTDDYSDPLRILKECRSPTQPDW